MTAPPAEPNWQYGDIVQLQSGEIAYVIDESRHPNNGQHYPGYWQSIPYPALLRLARDPQKVMWVRGETLRKVEEVEELP